jgi:hypothetical protein
MTTHHTSERGEDHILITSEPNDPHHLPTEWPKPL